MAEVATRCLTLFLALISQVGSFPTLFARQTGPPSCPTDRTQDVKGPCTTVEVFDQKINWGNAYPQDVISYLNQQGGACFQQTTCKGETQKLPTQLVRDGTRDEGERQLQLQVIDAEFPPDEKGAVKDAMFRAMRGALAVGVDQVPTDYSSLGYNMGWSTTYQTKTINQNHQTNEINVQYYNDGDLQGWIHVMITLEPSEPGLCAGFNKEAASYAQDGVVALSSIPVAGAFLAPVIGILGAVSAACTS